MLSILKLKEIFSNIYISSVRGYADVDATSLMRLWSRWGLLGLIVIVYIYRATGYLGPSLTPDAETTYIPYAKKVLEQGIGFFFNKDSILVAPMSYLWTALFGAKVATVKYVNLFAGSVMLVLVYQIGKNLHSHIAGLIAAFLFARSPLLINWIPTILSEPPYYLFTFIWLWGLCGVVVHKKWSLPVASLALSLSILTRPIWFYPAIIFILISVVWLLLTQGDKRLVKNIILLYTTALILPVLVIIKNAILFDFPAIAMGSGHALYLGTNIMTGGFEPPLLGLSYASGESPMSLVGNKEHMLVAIEFLKERTFSELATWFLTKVSWMLMFTPVDASSNVSIWRAIELSMAVIGVVWGIKQKSIVIIFFGAALILQICQSALVLYNIRYSADNIELLLIPLASIGVVTCFKLSNNGPDFDYSNNVLFGRNSFFSYGKLGLLLLVVLLLTIHFKLRPLPYVTMPEYIPVDILYEVKEKNLSANSYVKVDPISGQTFIEFPVSMKKRIDLRKDEPNDALWKIMAIVKPGSENKCREGRIGFRTEKKKNQDYYKVDFSLGKTDQVQTKYFGTTYYNADLFPGEDGSLVLSLLCNDKSSIEIKQVSLVSPHYVEFYWNKFVRQ